jgi:dolichol-phosphate mannosyltransferase
MNSHIKILFAIPVINEKRNLEVLLPQLLSENAMSSILVIDDGSSDGTQNYLQNLIGKFPSRLNYIYRDFRLGIGKAEIDALKFAINNNFDFVITLDGDLTHSVVDATRMAIKFEQSSTTDLLIGSRFLKKSKIQDWPVLRVLVTNLGHFLTRIVLGMKEDLSSGFRAYRVKSIPLTELMNFSMSGYDYFFKSAYVYKKLDLKIQELDVSLQHRCFGKSKLNFKFAFLGLVNLLTFRISAWKLKRNK